MGHVMREHVPIFRSGAALALYRGIGGIAAGVLLVVLGHRFSHVVSRWALANGLVELNGEWFLPRFIAWAIPGITLAAILWLLFRKRAVVPAVTAAGTVPVLYVATFLAFFGIADGWALVIPYLFESAVAFIAVPGTVYLIHRMHDP